MRKRRILSLLLAVAVMATMIMAVPLTASAADYKYDVPASSGTTITAGTTLISNDDIEASYVFNAKVKDASYTLDGFSGGMVEIRIGADIKETITDDSKISKNSDGQSPIKIVAKSDGVLTAYIGMAGGSADDPANRTLKFWDNFTGTNYDRTYSLATSTTTTSTFDIVSGHTYYMYTRGFTGNLLRLEYTKHVVEPKIEISPATKNAVVGQKGRLSAITQDLTEDATITWTSDNDQKVKVTPNEEDNSIAEFEVLSGAQVGDKITITAKSEEDNVSGTAELTVTKLPDNIYWRVDSEAVQSVLSDTKYSDNSNQTIFADGAEIGPKFSVRSDAVSYEYNSQTYSFTSDLQGGNGYSGTECYVSIVPAPVACKVTVLFNGGGSAAGREQYIVYNGETLATEKSVASSDLVAVEHIFTKAEIEAGNGAPIYTYGGGSNKRLYAFFIEYFEEPEFTKSATDKGYYYKNGDQENKLGVIRFLQSINDTDIKEFGFYIIKGSSGDIISSTTTKVSSTKEVEEMIENGGFYADIYGIAVSEADTSCVAVPFVTMNVGENATIIGSPISASMTPEDWERQVEYTEPAGE